MGSCQISKNQIICDLIEIIKFCLNIYNLWRHPQLWVGHCVRQWLDLCQIVNYQINLDLIEIIEFEDL